jgi:hypothetical protein
MAEGHTPPPSEPTTERLQTWKKKWTAGQTRWHKTDVHTSLERSVATQLLLSRKKESRVLVPLRGNKTVDMTFFGQEPWSCSSGRRG